MLDIKNKVIQNVMTRSEAEDYLNMSRQDFQYNLSVGKIPVLKTFHRTSRPIRLFWKPDLDKDNIDIELREIAKENVLTRPEAEEFLMEKRQNFQLRLRENRYPILKEYRREGVSKITRLFWKPDLEIIFNYQGKKNRDKQQNE
ncbi:hypothetical protein ABEP12_02035 [Bacillus velezensis]